jgi:hypothetical protein
MEIGTSIIVLAEIRRGIELKRDWDPRSSRRSKTDQCGFANPPAPQGDSKNPAMTVKQADD